MDCEFLSWMFLIDQTKCIIPVWIGLPAEWNYIESEPKCDRDPFATLFKGPLIRKVAMPHGSSHSDVALRHYFKSSNIMGPHKVDHG